MPAASPSNPDGYDEGFEAYFNCAEETWDEQTAEWQLVQISLSDLDDDWVALARDWAEHNEAPWPPFLPWAEEYLNDLRLARSRIS